MCESLKCWSDKIEREYQFLERSLLYLLILLVLWRAVQWINPLGYCCRIDFHLNDVATFPAFVFQIRIISMRVSAWIISICIRRTFFSWYGFIICISSLQSLAIVKKKMKTTYHENLLRELLLVVKSNFISVSFTIYRHDSFSVSLVFT